MLYNRLWITVSLFRTRSYPQQDFLLVALVVLFGGRVVFGAFQRDLLLAGDRLRNLRRLCGGGCVGHVLGLLVVVDLRAFQFDVVRVGVAAAELLGDVEASGGHVGAVPGDTIAHRPGEQHVAWVLLPRPPVQQARVFGVVQGERRRRRQRLPVAVEHDVAAVFGVGGD